MALVALAVAGGLVDCVPSILVAADEFALVEKVEKLVASTIIPVLGLL